MTLTLGQLSVLRSIVFAGALERAQDLVAHQTPDLQRILEDLKAHDLIEPGELLIPTVTGEKAVADWFARDRERAGATDRDAVIDQFRPLDLGVKQLSIDWQNADEKDDWDGRMLTIEKLSVLHDETLRFVADNAETFPRWKEFGHRLQAAIDAILDGETDYIVSVRLPSYHTTWFEFHEDLLRTLERQRDKE